MGIGGIPDAVLSALKDHKDLGIHTEMFTDGVVPLVESGAINNTKKKIYRGVPDSVFIFQFLSFPLCLSNSFPLPVCLSVYLPVCLSVYPSETNNCLMTDDVTRN